MTKLSNLTMIADQLITSSKNDLSSFTEKFAVNPLQAFEWADAAMTAAAKNDVGHKLLKWIEQTQKNKPEATAEEVYEIVFKELQDIVLRSAKWPHRSTSPASNQMSIEVLAVMADVADRLR